MQNKPLLYALIGSVPVVLLSLAVIATDVSALLDPCVFHGGITGENVATQQECQQTAGYSRVVSETAGDVITRLVVGHGLLFTLLAVGLIGAAHQRPLQLAVVSGLFLLLSIPMLIGSSFVAVPLFASACFALSLTTSSFRPWIKTAVLAISGIVGTIAALILIQLGSWFMNGSQMGADPNLLQSAAILLLVPILFVVYFAIKWAGSQRDALDKTLSS